METGETKPYDQLSDEEKMIHDQGAPVNENDEQYEKNIDVAHEMARAEDPEREMIKTAKEEGLGQKFIDHRKEAAERAANIAGDKERGRIESEEELINQAIDLLKEDAEGVNKSRLILYVFDKEGRHGKAYSDYAANQSSEGENNPSYNYFNIDMPMNRREQLARLLGTDQLVPTNEKEQNQGEKRYFARSANGYLREISVDVNIEDNPNNPDAIIYDRYRVE